MSAAPAARWFIALWPDEATRDALHALQAGWSWPPRARPTRAERLHMTLHFLGPLADGAVEPLREALAAVDAPPWRWTLRRASVWPGGIAVAEPARTPAAARALHAALAEVLRAQGLTPESRPWRPHVTLARRAHGAAAPAGFDPIAWTARGFELVCSQHGYRRVALRALAAGSGARPQRASARGAGGLSARRSGAGKW